MYSKKHAKWPPQPAILPVAASEYSTRCSNKIINASLCISTASVSAHLILTCRLAHLSVCVSVGKCNVAKRLSGSGCRLQW